eukprot:806356-Pyramimonas_sp.AAC.1
MLMMTMTTLTMTMTTRARMTTTATTAMMTIWTSERPSSAAEAGGWPGPRQTTKIYAAASAVR